MWVSLLLKLRKAGATIKWEAGFPRSENQQDAMFYKDFNGWICSVMLGDFEVDVYCDGETRVKNRINDATLTCGSDLIADGFDTDEKLRLGFESGDLVHDMNSWFDLYIKGEHIDAVTHEIEDAIDAAIGVLQEEVENAKAIELL
jgi:hypothetical protein